MIIKEMKFYEEVWGAKMPIYEYDIKESYDGEVFELCLKKIKEESLDTIPKELEVEDRGMEVMIDPFCFLSDDEVEKLEDEINKIWEE